MLFSSSYPSNNNNNNNSSSSKSQTSGNTPFTLRRGNKIQPDTETNDGEVNPNTSASIGSAESSDAGSFTKTALSNSSFEGMAQVPKRAPGSTIRATGGFVSPMVEERGLNTEDGEGNASSVGESLSNASLVGNLSKSQPSQAIGTESSKNHPPANPLFESPGTRVPSLPQASTLSSPSSSATFQSDNFPLHSNCNDVPDLVDEDSTFMVFPVGSSYPSSTSAAKLVSPNQTGLSPFMPSNSTVTEHKIQSSSTVALSSPLNSSLKKAADKGSILRKRLVPRRADGRSPATERRVRGLWEESILTAETTTASSALSVCFLDKLRDETVAHVFSFLNLADLVKTTLVARRFRSIICCSAKNTLWNRIDATEFVELAYSNFYSQVKSQQMQQEREASNDSRLLKRAQKLTGQALEQILAPHRPKALTIRNIKHRLSADSYLPGLDSLREVTLTHFDDMTDTHAHVLLLMTTHSKSKKIVRKKGSSIIRKQTGSKGLGLGSGQGLLGAGGKQSLLNKLSLEYCPRLTNATLRSIASQCSSSLEFLSIRGCTGITKLNDLSPMLLVSSASMGPRSLSSSNSYIESSRALEAQPPSEGQLPLPSHVALKVKPAAKESSLLMAMFAPSLPTKNPNDPLQKRENLFVDAAAPEQSSPLMGIFSPPLSSNSITTVASSSVLDTHTPSKQAETVKTKSDSMMEQTNQTYPKQNTITNTSLLSTMTLPRAGPSPTSSSPEIPAIASAAMAVLEGRSPPTSPKPNALQSLFAPPGTSPPQVNGTTSSSSGLRMISVDSSPPSLVMKHRRGLSGNIKNETGGKLCALDLRRTSVTPQALLDLLQVATSVARENSSSPTANPDSMTASIKILRIDGTQWVDKHLSRLAPLLTWNQLVDLDMECPDAFWGSLSDTGINTWLTDHMPGRLSRLSSLNLSGQSRLTGQALSQIVDRAPQLERLICRRNPRLLEDTATSMAPFMQSLSRMIRRRNLGTSAPTLESKSIQWNQRNSITSLGVGNGSSMVSAKLRHRKVLLDFRDCSLEPLVTALMQSTLVHHDSASSVSPLVTDDFVNPSVSEDARSGRVAAVESANPSLIQLLL